jgi:ribA/ribD-fused uncharacterized protein
MKTLNKKERKSFSNLNPSEAKRKGRRIELREDWEEVKDEIMFAICLSKFKQNSDLKQKLLNTNDEYLEEGNWWHDNYWGNCYCDKCQNITGQNKLGEILMKVRDKLGEYSER